MASKEMIGKISAFLGLALGHTIPPQSLPIWKEVLNPIPDELAERAAMEVVRKTTACFAPAPGAIYQAALDILAREELAPGEAWQQILEVIRDTRAADEVSGIAAAVVDQLGGWRTLYDLRTGDTTTRAHFLQLYREQKARVIGKRMRALQVGETMKALEVQHVA